MIKTLKNLFVTSIGLVSLYILFINNYELNIQSLLILLLSYFFINWCIGVFFYNINNSISIPLFALSNFYFFVCYVGLFFFLIKI